MTSIKASDFDKIAGANEAFFLYLQTFDTTVAEVVSWFGHTELKVLLSTFFLRTLSRKLLSHYSVPFLPILPPTSPYTIDFMSSIHHLHLPFLRFHHTQLDLSVLWAFQLPPTTCVNSSTSIDSRPSFSCKPQISKVWCGVILGQLLCLPVFIKGKKGRRKGMRLLMLQGLGREAEGGLNSLCGLSGSRERPVDGLIGWKGSTGMSV